MIEGLLGRTLRVTVGEGENGTTIEYIIKSINETSITLKIPSEDDKEVLLDPEDAAIIAVLAEVIVILGNVEGEQGVQVPTEIEESLIEEIVSQLSLKEKYSTLKELCLQVMKHGLYCPYP